MSIPVDDRKALLIGIGNPLRGDDGFGHSVVDHFEQITPAAPLEILAVQQLGLDLIDQVADARLVIFVDVRLGDDLGVLEQHRIQADSSLSTPISHFFDPHTLLSAVQALYGVHPPAYVVSVASNQFDLVEALSPAIQAAVPQAVAAVQALLTASF